MNLWGNDLVKEKKQLRRDLDEKVYEKFEILKRFEEDYEQTKLENIRYLDRIDELERQKEVIQDGYHMFSEENQRLRKRIRDLYSEKMFWFQERDQMLGKLEKVDLEGFERAKKTLECLDGQTCGLDLGGIERVMQGVGEQIRGWKEKEKEKGEMVGLYSKIF